MGTHHPYPTLHFLGDAAPNEARLAEVLSSVHKPELLLTFRSTKAPPTGWLPSPVTRTPSSARHPMNLAPLVPMQRQSSPVPYRWKLQYRDG